MSALALVVACNRDPIARLASAKSEWRNTEARLSGGFAWEPFRPHLRGERQPLGSELSAVVIDVLRASDHDLTSPHAAALADVLANDPVTAVVELEKLTTATSDPSIWNDLAAARYAASAAARRPESLVPALAAVDRALRKSNDLPEARFNRGLILERLGLRDPAITAWKSFLAVDSGSAWANEARQHLKVLETPDPQFPELTDVEWSDLETHPDEIRIVARTFPQEARLAAERESLARWGEAAKRGTDTTAERELTFASTVGAELARNGDQMLERCVAAIQRSRGQTRRLLAEGHIGFLAALKIFRSGRVGEAEPLFRRAARDLKAGGSPFAFMAILFAGYARYETGEVAASTREIEALLLRVPPELVTCRATVQWQLAICFGAQGRWGEDIDTAQASLAAFDRTGENANAALMREHVAQAYDLIGDPQTAWTYRAAALPVLGRTSTRFLQAGVLGFLAQDALFRQEWDEAASFTEVELEVGRKARYEPDLADAHLRRALIRHHLLSDDPAEDLVRARSIIAALPDPGMQSRIDARRVAVEALVARTPAEAVPLLTSAIEFHGGTRGQRMFLPNLLLHRARAERALKQLSAARRDVDAALAELDAGRGSLKSLEQRAGMFESTDGIVEEAIDLALEQRDPAAAFAYAERARARTLLDELQGRASAALLGIPAGHAIIEYAILPSRAVIFVATGTEIRVAIRAIDRDRIRANAAAFTDAVSRGQSPRISGPSVYDDLIAPVMDWIAASETVVIVPDATTAAVPFAAIPLPNGDFLVQRHAVIATPSAAVFAHASTKRRNASGRLLIVVNDSAAKEELEALPAAREEGRRIAASYRDVDTLLGPAATRAAFVRHAAEAQIIHFAGHALSSEYRAEDTAIILSGADGRMNTHDIAELQLNACSIVVLAACSSARGKVRRFEGTLSVARAFLAAGAPAVVATLWPIDDAEAAVFFPGVHERLARGLSAAEAVRAAQLQAIRDSRSPAVWASVQVIGS